MVSLGGKEKKECNQDPSVAPEALVQGMNVWCDAAPSVSEDSSALYSKCVVIDASDSQKVVLREMANPESEFTAKATQLFYCNENYDPLATADVGMLAHPNAASVLEMLKTRYLHDTIYTLADPLLVSINPFWDLGCSTQDTIKQYGDAANPGLLPPHIFSIARRAVDNMNSTGINQTILVSGESGAGKTEATKHIMRYFASAAGDIEAAVKPRDTRIESAVMAANPVLEAFGNAKTALNDNSSRFGKFVRLQLGKGGGIEHGHVQSFLLEKSRVVVQAENERSYHIFYQLIKGAPEPLRKKLALKTCQDYKLLNPHCVDIPGKNDAKDFVEVLAGFQSMGMDTEIVESVLSLVSGVLLLGNVQIGHEAIDGLPDAAVICKEDRKEFEKACELLFLDAEGVEEALLVRMTVAGSHEVKGRWTQHQSELLKDSLCKGVFERLFEWLVRQVNFNISNPKGMESFIGLLDIFGFEVFKNNSLEQLFINVTNELLQATFVDLVFTRESALYESEGITTEVLYFESPQPVISLLCAKKNSVLSLLEDSCLSPGSTDAKLTTAVKAQIKKARNRGSEKPGSDLDFTICHCIGNITYCTEGFIAKNKDQLRAEFAELLSASTNLVASQLYDGVEVVRGKLMKGQLIGSQFLVQLQNLISIIEETEPHFIRCVKPNDEKLPKHFNARKILPQLRALSILEAIQLRSVGYSYRRPFADFVRQYRFVNLSAMDTMHKDSRQASLDVLSATGLKDTADYRIGKTMVFLTRDAQQRIMALQRDSPARDARIQSNTTKELAQPNAYHGISNSKQMKMIIGQD
ncbi:myosin A [Cyclospora cayetanensis]|uniref:Myosin A n=1 Tax=Cyclospora cayetanensis TaxID=88456 RepID=A0A1D3CY50_9EIME|nr:myosin A [Cyclospora cayetanensis]